MALPAVHRTKIDFAALRTLERGLRDAFGMPFDVWTDYDGWQRISAIDECLPADEEWLSHLDALRTAPSEPRCVELDGTAYLMVPLPKQQRRHTIATARCDGAAAKLLVSLARLFLKELVERTELERLRHEHQAFLRQVTNDFEELTFLRSMSRLLEISDLSFDFVAMAETMLPTLKPLLESDALVLVGAQSAQTLQQTAIEPTTVHFWSGLPCLPQETCVKLVARFRAAAVSQPVVRNHFENTSDAAEFPGLHSFILVPIMNGQETIAWLVALNRNNDRNINVGECPWEVSYLEFGTHEATLMSSSAAILATHARNVDLFRERENLLVSVVRALVSAIEAKDEYTRGHSERVALYGKRLAEQLGYDAEYCERLYLTGLLHDVGKIGVRDAVLRKPGPLNDEEFAEIKTHPDKGWQILHDLQPLQYVLDGVLHHHEQFDGRGYPDKLAATAIPLDGRILAVADAFDAMTSDRPYRTGMPMEKAESILRSGSGKQWDPEMVEAFFRCLPDIKQIKESYVPRVIEQRQPV